jgi:hypothetical protein
MNLIAFKNTSVSKPEIIKQLKAHAKADAFLRTASQVNRHTV